MSDLFRIQVESNNGNSARLRVSIVSLDEVTFPLSAAFVMMLLEDEEAPGFARYEAWRRAAVDADERFNGEEHVLSITLLEYRGLPRAQGEPPAGMSLDDVDESDDPGVLGEALYEIVVDADGMLSHLEPGQVWDSTAYDEDGDGPVFLGAPGDPTRWERPS